MENKYKFSKNSQYKLAYHFVFCPRYRRKIFKEEGVANQFKQLVYDIATRLEWEVMCIELGEDYVYLVIEAAPIFSPNEIMAKLKNETSKGLRELFAHLSHLPSLWSRSFLVANEPLTEGVIRGYVAQQKKRG